MSDKTSKPDPNPATQVQVGGDVGGDVVLGNKTHTQTAGGDIVGGDKISNAEQPSLGHAFAEVYQRIATAAEDPNVDKAEIQETVKKIEGEVKKGEQANANKVERWLLTLGTMSEDIFAVTAATLTNPVLGVAKAIQLIAQKAKAEHAKREQAKAPAKEPPKTTKGEITAADISE